MEKSLFFSLIFVLGVIVQASTLSVDPKALCSKESEKRLAKLIQKGETRFSEFQFNPDSTQVSDVEFTDLGSSGHRRHRKPQAPAKIEYGKMLVMTALGKEKIGWRNLVVKCGVNRGKLATFTYEILSLAETSAPTQSNSGSMSRLETNHINQLEANSTDPETTPATEKKPASPGPASVESP